MSSQTTVVVVVVELVRDVRARSSPSATRCAEGTRDARQNNAYRDVGQTYAARPTGRPTGAFCLPEKCIASATNSLAVDKTY